MAQKIDVFQSKGRKDASFREALPPMPRLEVHFVGEAGCRVLLVDAIVVGVVLTFGRQAQLHGSLAQAAAAAVA
jgi:hypothetical protein